MSEEYTYQWEPYDAQGNFIEDAPILKVTKSCIPGEADGISLYTNFPWLTFPSVNIAKFPFIS